jgi:hypothetical protein
MAISLRYHSKYGAIRTEAGGRWFASGAEAKRYQELLVLARTGVVSRVTCQPSFDLVVNDEKVGIYRADFEVVWPDGEVHIEDVKGYVTPVFRLKAKMFKALYGFDIRIVKA